MADVANDRLIFHVFHMVMSDDMEIPRRRHKDIGLISGVIHSDHAVAFHCGLKCADRIDFSDPNLS